MSKHKISLYGYEIVDLSVKLDIDSEESINIVPRRNYWTLKDGYIEVILPVSYIKNLYKKVATLDEEEKDVLNNESLKEFLTWHTLDSRIIVRMRETDSQERKTEEQYVLDSYYMNVHKNEEREELEIHYANENIDVEEKPKFMQR